MDDLQYTVVSSLTDNSLISFKPCYKWMTFNTNRNIILDKTLSYSFKPCYKWMTFNT